MMCRKNQKWLLLLGLCACLCLCFPPLAQVYGSSVGRYGEDDPLSGSIQLKYRFRQNSESDEAVHRLFQSADVLYQPESLGGFSFAISGEVFETLSGNSNDGNETINDIFDDSEGMLYEAYAAFKPLASPFSIKAGRQYTTHLFSLHMDGADFSYAAPNSSVNMYLYGGKAADVYDVDGLSDAYHGGGGVSWRWGRKSELGLEYLYSDESVDEDSLVDASDETYNQVALSIKRYGGYGYMKSLIRMFDGDIESTKFSGAFFIPGVDDLELNLSYFRQWIEVDRKPTALSPFLSLLGPVKPYQQITWLVSKGFENKNIIVMTGGDWRDLLEANDDTEFNHGYLHGFLALEKAAFISEDMSLTLQADLWQRKGDTGDGNDSGLFTGGGEIGYEWSEKTELGAGSYYSLYSYDYYLDENEKTDVYTVFLRFDYQPSESLRFKGEYDWTMYDIDEHRVVLTTIWRF